MNSIPKSSSTIKQAFLVAIESVQPENLIPKWLQRNGNRLLVGDRNYDLCDTYVVGFGKAVAGMIPAVVTALNSTDRKYLKKAVLSVPYGIETSSLLKEIKLTSSVELCKGARSNLPDEEASTTASKIVDLVKQVGEEELLIILISGGGSSLLPLPIYPITLKEKTSVIRQLSQAGASITELNTVRKAISATKGGKLAQMTSSNIIAFILSDVINSPLDIIASGPTVQNKDSFSKPTEVLHKYQIPISERLQSVLESRKNERPSDDFSHVNNIIVGDNMTALQAAQFYIGKQFNCNPLILSQSVSGDAATIGRCLAKFSLSVLHSLHRGRVALSIDAHLGQFIARELIEQLDNLIRNKDEVICLLFGGETTVQVRGSGIGGRNQEMVLAASVELEKTSARLGPPGEIVFLSGGTDGIDGQTDAAGAFTWYSSSNRQLRCQAADARSVGLFPEEYLSDNDSNTYFERLQSGQYLLTTGHTGTNVMDIQLLFINKYSQLHPT